MSIAGKHVIGATPIEIVKDTKRVSRFLFPAGQLPKVSAYLDGLGDGVLGGTMTESGFEITDALRAAATSGDGRGYKPVTNLVPNGGAEANLNNITTTGFGPGSVGTTTRITTDAKFGTACVDFNVTTYATGNSWAFVFFSGLPLFKSGETYTLSAWVKLVSGTNQWNWHIGDTTSTNLVKPMSVISPLKVGVWQKITTTFTATQSGVAPGVFITPRTPGVSGVGHLLIDGVQVEVGPQAHDYVDTQSNAPQTAVQRTRTRNHFLNPDFEVDTSWWLTYTGPTTLAIDTTRFFEGAQSLKCTNGGAGANVYGAVFALHQIAGGLTYTASAYVYSSAARNFNLNVQPRDVNNANIGALLVSGTVAVAANTWTRLTITFTSPVNATSADFAVAASNAAVAETFNLDAVQLEVAATATAYMSGEQLTPLDQSTGIWPAVTNLINGGFETDVSGWSGASSPSTLTTITRELNVAKFGSASLRCDGVVGQAMTVAGTPITDTLRALNVEGDGRSYQYVFNNCPNGSFETVSTGWSAFNTGSTILRDSTHAKVGTWGLKVTTPGTTVGGGGEGCTGPATAVGSAALGQVWTGSVWVWSAAGGEQVVWGIDERDAAGGFLSAAISNYTLVAGWQRLLNTRVLLSPTVSRIGSYFRTQGVAQAITVWLDSVQYEIGGVSHDTVETTTVGLGAIQGPLLTNYCTNGDFEYGTTGWTNFGTGTITRTTAQQQFGLAAGAIAVSAALDGAFYAALNLRQDRTYTASVWFKGTAARTYRFQLTGNPSGTSRGLTDVVASGNWQRVTVSGTPAGAEVGMNLVCRAVNAGADTFFIDGVQFEEDAVAGLNVSTSSAATFGGSIGTAISSTVSTTGAAIAPDSSYGAHEGTTNLLPNGGMETGLANTASAGLNGPTAWGTQPAVGAGTGLTGTYIYRQSVYATTVNGTFESGTNAASTPLAAANQDIIVTLPNTSNGDATGRKLYRSSDGGTTWKLAATILGVATGVTYDDSTPDGSLTTVTLPVGTPPGNGQALVSRVTTGARFGSACAQAQLPGAVAAEGMFFSTATGLARAAGSVISGSVWVKGTAGLSVHVWTRINNTDGSVLDNSGTIITMNGDWMRILAGVNTVGVGKTGDSYSLMVRTAVLGMGTLWVDGAQVEEKSYSTPYVHTNGGTASRTAARISVGYTSFLGASTGSATFRVRFGFSSTETAARGAAFGGTSLRLLDWSTDTNNRILVVLGTDNFIRTFRQSGGAGASAQTTSAVTFNAGDYATITARWDSGNVYISFNGATTSAANTSIPTLPTTTVDLGTNGASAGYFDGDLLFALTGNGTVNDLAALQALTNDPVTSPLAGGAPVPVIPNSAISALFPFATSSFSDFKGSFPNVRTTGFAATAGTPYAFGAHVLTQPGQTITARIVRADFVTVIGTATFTATGGWQYVSTAGIAPATETIYCFLLASSFTNGGSMWVDGAQLEVGYAPTPFAPTSRTASRVRGPAALLTTTQGWYAMQFRADFGSAISPGGGGAAGGSGNEVLFDWRDDANNRLTCFYGETGRQFAIKRGIGGVFDQATSADVGAFSAGQVFTLIFKWTATTLAVSVNGGAFVTQAGATNIPGLAATLFDIGNSATLNQSLYGSNFWSLAGTGTLSDANAATIAAAGAPTWSTSGPTFASTLPGTPVIAWAAGTSAYWFVQLADGVVVPIVYDLSGNLVAVGDQVAVPQGSAAKWYDLTFSNYRAGATIPAGATYRLGLLAGGASVVRSYGDAGAGETATDVFTDGAAATFGTVTADAFDMTIYGDVFGPWTPPAPELEFYYARLPFAEAQKVLSTTRPVVGSGVAATATWHGTGFDPERGSFVVLQQDGLLDGAFGSKADLVGERVKITARGLGGVQRSIVAFVHNADVIEGVRGVTPDISIPRRLWMRLALPGDNTCRVVVERLA